MVTPQTVYDYHPGEDRLEVLQGPGNPVGLRPVAIRHRAADDPRPRRQRGAGVGRPPQGLREGRHRASCSSTPMAPTAMPSRRASRPAASACSTAASPIAIAHIRGGDDLGYQWFLDGKLDQADQHLQRFRRRRAKGLIARGYAKAGRIAIQGGSAGGELMGAVVNQAIPSCGARSSPTCRSSTCSTRCSTTRCR